MLERYIYVGYKFLHNLKKETIMKLVATLIASMFAVSAFAQAPAAPAKKEEAKPAAAAPAKKEEAKPAAKPADKKAEPAKSEPAKK